MRLLKWTVALAATFLLALFAGRIWESQRGPPLELWHTVVPRELNADEIAKSDWAGYLASEDSAFDKVRAAVTAELDAGARNPANRYFDGSPIYPGRFVLDWNRSFILEPDRAPVGAVVLLHGLTDSPYSLRHIAQKYRDLGWLAVGVRLPAHGTVPAALTDVRWDAWSEAARLAVREAQRRTGASLPLHVVGYSNGGALAMKYALDALDNAQLARPDRLVLLSPMIGITELARFSGILGWPAVFPAFAKAAWLDIVPEFNPFKYNSFPVNAAQESSLLVRSLQAQIERHARAGRLRELAPVLTFQSIVDFTVSTRAVVTSLYDHLPANGSELVLFDLNRSATFGPLLRPGREALLDQILPAGTRSFTTSVITNASADRRDVVERVTPAGSTTEKTRDVGLSFPFDVYSLSHIALPFPLNDALYGMQPDPADNFGINLGAIAVRGERATLVVSQDLLTRMSSNPFFPYLIGRIEQQIGGASGRP